MVIHYEEALYQVYAPLSLPFTHKDQIRRGSTHGEGRVLGGSHPHLKGHGLSVGQFWSTPINAHMV